eukprot:CAMPEP_0204533294 /NCGR_PEP_ID=MMETSP0661-20131031/12204_1 /ASSEMBLY_ACC=CAM_ASM_000606 /TAXON_ID=109239 /ORGANISM="Alexandrium margalefi, Strain AMGDE01CS-322" /LENGTH=174 /DNA_ID=CAMNT_0051539627 /DNA_START=30 /DNA_END=554 /DNA_ORIENTATION=+
MTRQGHRGSWAIIQVGSLPWHNGISRWPTWSTRADRPHIGMVLSARLSNKAFAPSRSLGPATLSQAARRNRNASELPRSSPRIVLYNATTQKRLRARERVLPSMRPWRANIIRATMLDNPLRTCYTMAGLQRRAAVTLLTEGASERKDCPQGYADTVGACPSSFEWSPPPPLAN